MNTNPACDVLSSGRMLGGGGGEGEDDENSQTDS